MVGPPTVVVAPSVATGTEPPATVVVAPATVLPVPAAVDVVEAPVVAGVDSLLQAPSAAMPSATERYAKIA